MFDCPNCFAQFTKPGGFCTKCGTDMSFQHEGEVMPPDRRATSATYGVAGTEQATAHAMGHVFSLHPAVAFFTMAINLMLFGKDGLAVALAPMTGGSDIPIALLISVAVGALVGYVTYLGQMKWYSDDHESAKIKAIITGVLTAMGNGW